MASILTLEFNTTEAITININEIKFIKFNVSVVGDSSYNYLEIDFGSSAKIDAHLTSGYFSSEVLRKIYNIILTMMEETTDTTKVSRRVSITKDTITEISSRYYLNK